MCEVLVGDDRGLLSRWALQRSTGGGASSPQRTRSLHCFALARCASLRLARGRSRALRAADVKMQTRAAVLPGFLPPTALPAAWGGYLFFLKTQHEILIS